MQTKNKYKLKKLNKWVENTTNVDASLPETWKQDLLYCSILFLYGHFIFVYLFFIWQFVHAQTKTMYISGLCTL